MRIAVALSMVVTGSAVFASDQQPGCGLPVVHAMSGSVLFIGVIGASPFRIVAWPLGAEGATRVRLEVPGRLLQSQSGTGPAAWLASVDERAQIHLFRVTPGGQLIAAGKVRSSGVPGAFTWSEDAAGAPWIFVLSVTANERNVEAFRLEGARWTPKGSVAVADMRTPRAAPGSRESIIFGAWRFSAIRAPRRIPVSGSDDLAEIFPGRGELMELRLDDLVVLTSKDSGVHWREVPPPWPSGTRFDSPPEQIDRNADAPTLRWAAHGRVYVARFDGADWSTVLDAAAGDFRGLGGPAVTMDGSLIFIDLCYRIAKDADSFRIAMIKDGRVQTKTVLVSK